MDEWEDYLLGDDYSSTDYGPRTLILEIYEEPMSANEHDDTEMDTQREHERPPAALLNRELRLKKS